MLIVVCCLLLSASAVAIVVTNATSTSASAINARRQQRTGAAETMVKSCSGERSQMSIFVHILLNKEPSLVAGLSLTAFGGNRNPPEFRRNPE
jgi:hypothetical protein